MNVRHDEDLMLTAGQGELDAFEQIVLRHQAEAWRVAYRFAGDSIRSGFGQQAYFALWLSPMLGGFSASLIWDACRFHRHWRAKGL